MTAILIGGEKGGTGKSTIATNLAIMASIMGKDVLILDTDKQATSSKFVSNRNELGIKPTPTCVQIRGKYLHKEIEDLSKRYEIIIIDAGGQDSVELRAAMASASVQKVYTPIQPSHFDLETVSTMDDLVSMAKSFNEKLSAFLIFNKAPTHSGVNLLKEAMDYCSECENINICDSIIRHRVPFVYAASKYNSVVEFDLERMKNLPAWQRYEPKASFEICSLYRDIFGEEFVGEITNYFKNEELNVPVSTQ